MSMTFQHEGKDYIIVDQPEEGEITAYREYGDGHIEMLVSFQGMFRVVLLQVSAVKKVLEWRDFSRAAVSLERDQCRRKLVM
ncbi:hypothetical protein [Paenibacillus chitinolyticus]|uniref:hypothetical protein n=1 Tax=Paenibacillus chitinolyticus TaxID=79263 RepID=UPI00364A8C79